MGVHFITFCSKVCSKIVSEHWRSVVCACLQLNLVNWASTVCPNEPVSPAKGSMPTAAVTCMFVVSRTQRAEAQSLSVEVRAGKVFTGDHVKLLFAQDDAGRKVVSAYLKHGREFPHLLINSYSKVLKPETEVVSKGTCVAINCLSLRAIKGISKYAAPP
nr:hypothetical protein [Agrobacterium salinitolerans]